MTLFQVLACGRMNEDGVDEFGSGTLLYSGAKSLYISPAVSSFSSEIWPSLGILEFMK